MDRKSINYSLLGWAMTIGCFIEAAIVVVYFMHGPHSRSPVLFFLAIATYCLAVVGAFVVLKLAHILFTDTPGWRRLSIVSGVVTGFIGVAIVYNQLDDRIEDYFAGFCVFLIGFLVPAILRQSIRWIYDGFASQKTDDR